MPSLPPIFPLQDTWMNDAARAANYGNQLTMTCSRGALFPNGIPLIQFDISALPSGAVVNNAVIDFYFDSHSAPAAIRGLGLLKSRNNEWIEDECTWDRFRSADPGTWTGGGANNGNSDYDGATGGWENNLFWPINDTQYQESPNLANLINAAIARGDDTFTLRLTNQNASVSIIQSSEGANPPRLRITDYTVNPNKVVTNFPAYCSAAIEIEQGVSTPKSGETEISFANANTAALLRFPIPFIPTHESRGAVTVGPVYLRLNMTASDGVNRILGIDRVLDPLTYTDPQPTALPQRWDNTATWTEKSTTTNELQFLDYVRDSGQAYGAADGSFTITVPGLGTTAPIVVSPGDDTHTVWAPAIQAELDALAAGEFLVTWVDNTFQGSMQKFPGWFIEFIGARANSNQALLTVDNTLLNFASIVPREIWTGGPRQWDVGGMDEGVEYVITNHVEVTNPVVGIVDIDVTQLVLDARAAGNTTVELRLEITSGILVSFESPTGSIPPTLICNWTEANGIPAFAEVYMRDWRTEGTPGARAEVLEAYYAANYTPNQLRLYHQNSRTYTNEPPYGHDRPAVDALLASRDPLYTGMHFHDFEEAQIIQLETSYRNKIGGYFLHRTFEDIVHQQWLGLTDRFTEALPLAPVCFYHGMQDPAVNNLGFDSIHHTDTWIFDNLYVGHDIAQAGNYNNDDDGPPYFSESRRSALRAVLNKADEMEALYTYRPQVYMWIHHRKANHTGPDNFKRLSVEEARAVYTAMRDEVSTLGNSLDGFIFWDADFFYWQSTPGDYVQRDVIRAEMVAHDPPLDPDSEDDFYLYYNEIIQELVPEMFSTPPPPPPPPPFAGNVIYNPDAFGGAGTTTFILPFSFPECDQVVLGEGWDDQQNVVFSYSDDPLNPFDVELIDGKTYVTVPGRYDDKDKKVIFGQSFKAEVELSTQFVRDENNNPIDGVLNMRSLVTRHFETGAYDVEVIRRGRDPLVTKFNSLGSSLYEVYDDPNRAPLIEHEGEMVSQVFGYSDTTRIKITSTYPVPMNITNMEIKGKFRQTYTSANT